MDYFTINYGLPLAGILITAVAQMFVKSSYNKYKSVDNRKKIAGWMVAREILDQNGLKDVKVLETTGELSDHYDPSKKVVKLSRDIYNGNSIASVAVAAHECGHALQDKHKYMFLKFRAFLVPIVNLSTKIGYLVVLIGLIFGFLNLAWMGIILLLSMLLFQIVTLPVEFNASKRALGEIQKLNILEQHEHKDAKTMLNAAAFTYVAGMLSTLLQILRLVLIVGNRRDD